MSSRETQRPLDEALATVLEAATVKQRLDALLHAVENHRVPVWWATFVLNDHPELLTP